jgi:hypoxanthine phosphoribosyltransferase
VTDGRPPVAPVLVASRNELATAVDRVARRIEADHPEGFTAVAVLKSAVPFVADLVRRVNVPVRVEFLAIAPFDGATRRTRVVCDLDHPVVDEAVVVVTGLIDTGLTIDYLTRHLAHSRPRSVRVATVAHKPSRRLLPAAPDYVAVEAPDHFLVGYGLDFAGRYRNLADLWAVDGAALHRDPDRHVETFYRPEIEPARARRTRPVRR